MMVACLTRGISKEEGLVTETCMGVAGWSDAVRWCTYGIDFAFFWRMDGLRIPCIGIGGVRGSTCYFGLTLVDSILSLFAP